MKTSLWGFTLTILILSGKGGTKNSSFNEGIQVTLIRLLPLRSGVPPSVHLLYLHLNLQSGLLSAARCVLDAF